MNKQLPYQKGFARVVLLLVVLLVAIGGVLYFVVMGSNGTVSDKLQSLYAKPSPTVVMTQKGLGEDLQELEASDSDPSTDFMHVDEDIESL